MHGIWLKDLPCNRCAARTRPVIPGLSRQEDCGAGEQSQNRIDVSRGSGRPAGQGTGKTGYAGK